MATKKSSPSSDSSIPDTVLLEGSVTPAVGILRRGERATVPYTPNVEDLIRRGFVDIVARSVDGTLPPAPEPTAPDKPATPVTPEMPQGTDQELVEATPLTPEPDPEPNPDVDNSLVEVANPDVDNSLVNPNGK